MSVDVDSTALVTDLGATRSATAEVALGDLGPGEVSVELLQGPVTASDDLADWQVVRMELAGQSETPGVDRLERQLRLRRRRPSRLHGPRPALPQ